MKKIVINRCYGGFGLSKAAQERMPKGWDGERDDPYLVTVVEELGKGANGSCSSLEVVSIPDDVEWQIEEYDGIEWVAEKHRTWPGDE